MKITSNVYANVNKCQSSARNAVKVSNKPEANKRADAGRSFSGLWGKTSLSTDFDVVLNIPKIQTTTYYYPFKDEKASEIDEILKQNTDARVDRSTGWPRYMIDHCRLGYTIPYTAEEYDEYYRASNFTPVVPKKMQELHKYAKDKYLDNKYGREQKTAQNPVLIKRLQTLKNT